MGFFTGFFTKRLLEQGSVAYQQGDWQLAVSVLSKAIEHDPGLFDAYRFRAAAYLRGEQYENVIKDLTHAIRINPNHIDIASVYFLRGNIYGAIDQIDAAIADFSRVIELGSSSVDIIDVYFNRGQAYRATNRFIEAEEDFNTVIARNPNKRHVYLERGFVYIELGLDTEGLEDLHYALECDPTDIIILNNLALYLEEKRGDFAQALFYYDQAAQLGDEISASNAEALRERMAEENNR